MTGKPVLFPDKYSGSSAHKARIRLGSIKHPLVKDSLS